MTEQELGRLAQLLGDFVDWDTDHSSLYGRQMDRALALDLLRSLVAYGLSRKDSETIVMRLQKGL